MLPEEAVPSEESLMEGNVQEGKLFSHSSEQLSFEQQKELLKIRLEHEKEIKQMKQKTELLKLELEQDKFKLSVRETKQFNVGANLQLLPKFSVKDPDLFFSLFERVADARAGLMVSAL